VSQDIGIGWCRECSRGVEASFGDHRGLQWPVAVRGRPCIWVSQGWVSRLLARYRVEGEAAFEPRSRRPKSSSAAVPVGTVELIVRVRKDLAGQGLDAGPATIAWHLQHHHRIVVSVATVGRYLTRLGLVVSDPGKRPRSSYVRFAASDHGCYVAVQTLCPAPRGIQRRAFAFLAESHRRQRLKPA
jgi:hypothetical protein